MDDGFVKVLNNKKKVSVLPKGITEVCGNFIKGSVIDVKDKSGNLLAKGITNYSSSEIELIKGNDSDKIELILSNFTKKEVIHANDMVVLRGEEYGRFTK